MDYRTVAPFLQSPGKRKIREATRWQDHILNSMCLEHSGDGVLEQQDGKTVLWLEIRCLELKLWSSYRI